MNDRYKILELGDVCEIQSGSGFPHKYQGERSGKYPFYKVSDMNLLGNEVEISIANNYISEDVRQKLKASIFPAGCIIFPKVGGAIATNKKRMTTQECCVDNNLMGLIPDSAKITKDYLRLLMSEIDIYELSNKANPPSIRQSTVKSWKISIPPLAEQKRIVEFLDEIFTGIDKVIENTEQKLIYLNELKQSYLKKAFKGELSADVIEAAE